MLTHYFPRYSQRENFQTNNTLLLFREFYNYNRLRFQKFLLGLLQISNVDIGNSLELGLQIRQQIGKGDGIIDGYLYQDAFRIAIETKRNANGFSKEQLTRHLSGFAQPEGGFLILLSPEPAHLDGSAWNKVLQSATDKNVAIVSVTFDSIVAAARRCLSDYDEEMHALVTDYEDFCSDEDLLPKDKWTLFAPPCGKSHLINISDSLYFCPASWARRKAKFFGIYYEKAVRYIGIITKVVECEIADKKVTSETVPLTKDERERIVRSSETAMQDRGWDLTTGYQFFLCDNLAKTEFKKTAAGGIMGHRYFDLREYISEPLPTNVVEIADKLRRNW